FSLTPACPFPLSLPYFASFLFTSMSRPPPSSTLFPYTTLFRSVPQLAELVGPGATQITNLNAEAGITDLTQAVTITGTASALRLDRKSTRLNSSHVKISYAVFCLKKKIIITKEEYTEPKQG